MKYLLRDGCLRNWLLAIAAVLPLGGCAEELGPEPMRTTRVRGTVKQLETPVRGGWIEFIPAEGTVGTQRSARIQENGSFEADHVPIGEVAIRLMDITVVEPFPISPKDARRIFGSFPPAIRKTIPEQPSELNLELIQELVSYQARRNAANPASSAESGTKP